MYIRTILLSLPFLLVACSGSDSPAVDPVQAEGPSVDGDLSADEEPSIDDEPSTDGDSFDDDSSGDDAPGEGSREDELSPGESLEPAGTAEEFLAANAARDGVTVTASGLQYEVLEDAVGARPAATATVTVHYVGTRIDGTEFDSSRARGEPNTFTVAGLIDGFAEGLQLMSVGSRYRFVLPADLAYGEAGAGTDIAPGTVLIFDVELLEINA